MRILAALAFLIVIGATLWLSQQLMVRLLRNLGRGKREWLGNFLIGTTTLVLQFVAFWLLTGRFPGFLVLLLVAGSLVSVLIHEMLGAIGGFGLQETKEKVSALGAIWGARNAVAGCILSVIGLIYLVVQTVGSLWIFFSHPRGSDIAVGWIALLLFIGPRLVHFPVQMAAVWPVVTSEFVDNDVRNTYLSSQFVSMINFTIICVYPFILFREPMAAAVGQVPPLWLLLSIPVFLFLLLGLIPYFLGSYRFRAQANALLRWRRQWLTDALPAVRLPPELRGPTLEGKLQQLKEEISRRIEENRLLRLYRQYLPDEMDSDDPEVDEPAAQIAQHAGGGVDSGAVVPSATPVSVALLTPEAQRESAELNQVKKALAYIRRRGLPPRVQSDDIAGNMLAILARYRERLVEWDVGFREIRALLDLYAAMLQARLHDVSAYIEAQLKNINEDLAAVRGSSRWAVGSLITGLSTVLVAVLKAYQEEILAIIVKVIGA